MQTHDKPARQALLLKLVQERPVPNQQAIVRLMRRAGVPVTQASVSRDIRELGLVKLDGRYARVPAAVARRNGAARDPALGLIKSVEPVGANLLVVRTTVGAAGSVAVALDRLELAGAAGTLAGDDTIFIAVRSRSAQGQILARLRSAETAR